MACDWFACAGGGELRLGPLSASGAGNGSDNTGNTILYLDTGPFLHS